MLAWVALTLSVYSAAPAAPQPTPAPSRHLRIALADLATDGQVAPADAKQASAALAQAIVDQRSDRVEVVPPGQTADFVVSSRLGHLGELFVFTVVVSDPSRERPDRTIERRVQGAVNVPQVAREAGAEIATLLDAAQTASPPFAGALPDFPYVQYPSPRLDPKAAANYFRGHP